MSRPIAARWQRLRSQLPGRLPSTVGTADPGPEQTKPVHRRPRVPRPPTLDEVLAAAAAGAEQVAAADDAATDVRRTGAHAGDGSQRRRSTDSSGKPGGDVDALSGSDLTRFGRPGRPLNRGHPFYVGFVGAVGVLVAIGLVETVTQLSQVITLLVVSLFLALGLDPVVGWLQKRGLPRAAAIGTVFVGVIGVFAGFIAAVIPPVVAQAGDLLAAIPDFIDRLQLSPTVQRWDEEYGLLETLSDELRTRLATGETVSLMLGGVLGAGRAVVSGTFGVLTVLVLTLYFLASLRPMKEAAYRLVPRTRRHRVRLLGDEIVRRIGGYVIGQLSIATLNGLLSYVVMMVLGVPYATVLALAVGVFGLIPLVGATIGAVLVVTVALFDSVSSAVILAIYYVVYQQVENYVLAPRIMARAVSVPGALAVIAALAGGSLLGILGALIAIPVAAGLLLIVQEVIVPRQERL